MTRARSFAPSLLLVLLAGGARADEEQFRKQVAPLLTRRCLACHAGTRTRGGLDLSSREKMLAGGDTGPALVPGKSAQSLLIEQVTGDKPAMPKKGQPLTAQEVAVLKAWIDGGAAWPKGVRLDVAQGKPVVDAHWWSLKPLTRPALPNSGKAQAGNPVDAFIVAKLKERGLDLSPEADRRTLIRRLTFDLHGLPPTPEEVESFVKDTRPDAYVKLVDRLLASPRYGERWGRHWLDVVHYADTHGYDKDKRRVHAWPYRDYVIRAFNEDRPYPRFVREQLAGDVLYPHDPEGVIATGFLAAGPWDFVGQVELREGTVDKMKTRLLDRDDMLSSTMSTFVSMTVHCARCHDHKFDPIPQADYYRLQAVFSGIERGDRPYEDRSASKRRLALQTRRGALTKEIAGLRTRVESVRDPALQKLDGELRELKGKLAGLPPLPAQKASPSNGWHSGISPKADVVKWVQVDLGRSMPIDELRLVPARPTDFADTPGFGFPTRFQVAVADEPTFARAVGIADHSGEDFANPKNDAVRLHLKDTKARYVRVTAQKLWKRTGDYVFALAELQVLSGGKNVALGATVSSLDSIEAGRWSRRYLVDDFNSRQRLRDRSDPAVRQREQVEALLATKTAERRKLLDRLTDADTRHAMTKAGFELVGVEKKIAALAVPPKVYGILPHAPRPIHILTRGEVEKPGKLVGPGAMTCVVGPEAEFKLTDPANEGQRRAALAEWIVDRKNPLTYRSIANRVWHYHFAKGIVDTPNDFGGNGAKPTHPELLDWLACEFREHGSFKKLHRQIVLSRTYRQQSRHDEKAAKIDADNRLLWRMNRQRLDAEAVRDSVLAVSGKLDLTAGGPGFDLFRFKDDHSPVYDHTSVEHILDPRTFRRTVYRFTVRSVPNPFLDCLDCADPNVNTPVRNTTLTALQALALLNNPFMVRQAEFFAERVKKEAGGDVNRQIDRAVLLAFARPATTQERQALAGFARKHGLAAACRLLLNANEFVFVD
jgi:hypothetical protein